MLKPYIVSLQEIHTMIFPTQDEAAFKFDCWADDKEHAKEQAQDAYPLYGIYEVQEIKTIQCCSCESVIHPNKLTKNRECPNCHSGNWIFGHIDDH